MRPGGVPRDVRAMAPARTKPASLPDAIPPRALERRAFPPDWQVSSAAALAFKCGRGAPFRSAPMGIAIIVIAPFCGFVFAEFAAICAKRDRIFRRK